MKTALGRYLGIINPNIKFILNNIKLIILSPINKENKVANYVEIYSNCIMKNEIYMR